MMLQLPENLTECQKKSVYTQAIRSKYHDAIVSLTHDLLEV